MTWGDGVSELGKLPDTSPTIQAQFYGIVEQAGYGYHKSHTRSATHSTSSHPSAVKPTADS